MTVRQIYLDHSATTKPHQEVLDTFIQSNTRFFANPSSLHQLGVEANSLLTRAREQLAQILKTEADCVIFTSGGTESNNFALKGIARANQHIGKHILVSSIEHPSVLESARSLEREGFELGYIPVDDNGQVDLEELEKLVRNDTILVSVMHVNNEIGSIQPIQEIAKLIRKKCRAFFHVDAVQSFGKLPIYFQGNDGPDLLTISGHKIHGLKGTGLLAMRRKMNLEPIIHGGSQEFSLRSGTVAVPQAVSLAKAARLAIEKQEVQLAMYQKWKVRLLNFLKKFPDVLLLSNEYGAPHILSFCVKDIKGEVIVNALQKEGIIVSTSSACSSKQTKVSHVIEALRIADAYKKGMIRLSFGEGLVDSDLNTFERIFTKVYIQLKGDVLLP